MTSSGDAGFCQRRRFRLVALVVWAGVLGLTAYLFFFRRESVQRELLNTMSASIYIAGLIYLVMGCVRGFTLLPVTSLLLVGVAFFPPVLLFVLTLVGILVSSASIYGFSEALHLEEVFRGRDAAVRARVQNLLAGREIPVIVGWSFFPFAPTDLIVYVCGVLRVDVKKCLLGVLIGEGAICGVYIFLGDWLLRTSGFKL